MFATDGTSWFKVNDGIFSPPRTPHALDTRMPHIWYHANRHEQWNRMTHDHYFIEELGLALASKTRPRRPQSFKQVDNGQAFP